MLHSDTTDISKTNKIQSELKTDLEVIVKDIEKISTDAASEASLNIRK
jgi:hypothetical protein